MKTRILLSTGTMLMAAALLFAPPATAGDLLQIGAGMPMMSTDMKNVDGSMVSLADVKGEKGTLLVFTCNHCPYVKAWEDRTVQLMNDAMEDGYGVIAINSNDPTSYEGDSFEGMVERAATTGMRYPYVVDAGSRLAAAFGATRTPEFFLFDADGKLVYTGALDDNAQDASAVSATYLADAMTAQAHGRDVPTAMTKSVGCTIKWYQD